MVNRLFTMVGCLTLLLAGMGVCQEVELDPQTPLEISVQANMLLVSPEKPYIRCVHRHRPIHLFVEMDSTWESIVLGDFNVHSQVPEGQIDWDSAKNSRALDVSQGKMHLHQFRLPNHGFGRVSLLSLLDPDDREKLDQWCGNASNADRLVKFKILVERAYGLPMEVDPGIGVKR